jgi:hypothetical protein
MAIPPASRGSALFQLTTGSDLRRLMPETSSCIQRSVAVRDRTPGHPVGGIQRTGSHGRACSRFFAPEITLRRSLLRDIAGLASRPSVVGNTAWPG